MSRKKGKEEEKKQTPGQKNSIKNNEKNGYVQTNDEREEPTDQSTKEALM